MLQYVPLRNMGRGRNIMVGSTGKRSIVWVVLAVFFATMAAAEAVPGSWAERVQVVYDPQNRTVERVRLKVWDPEPHRNLEFSWEPDRSSAFAPAATGGVVEGRGKLVWRVRGSAAHDRRSIYSTYVGDMKDGRPHGKGRLERRGGEVFEGEWVAGALHGQGKHRDADGNSYEGTLANGIPRGLGRQAMADGSIYVGSFRDGLRDGEGRLRLPGGTEYASNWLAGIEKGATRPDALADATVGGLLKAQAGGGDAGKVQLSVIVEPRMTQEAMLPYAHAVLDDRIEIYPHNEKIVQAWIGEAVIREGGLDDLDNVDWNKAPAFVQVRFETQDGSRVRLDGLELRVEDSQVYRKPFLEIVEHPGCIGYRPTFTFMNYGWGRAQDARLDLEFFNLDDPEKASRGFSQTIGSFDLGTDVSLRDVLAEAGVDTRTLAQARFTCPSLDEVPQCRRQIVGSTNFGEVQALLSGSLDLSVGVRGKIAFTWEDDRGNRYEANEPFSAALQLGFIETEMLVAEYGDGVGDAPEALRYHTVHLEQDAQNYVVELPLRGNKNLAAYVSLLKIFADQSSIHQFQAVARFADGSERYSKPVALFYIKPQMDEFHEIEEPTDCYIDPGYLGRQSMEEEYGE